jgi:hypothetical protein
MPCKTSIRERDIPVRLTGTYASEKEITTMLKPNPFYSDRVWTLVEKYKYKEGALHRIIGDYDSEYLATLACQTYKGYRQAESHLEVLWSWRGFGEGEYNYE